MIFKLFSMPERREMPEPLIEVETEVSTGVKLECRVVLYNDEWHTFDEVINQIIKATSCDFEKARALTFEVHVKGKAIVFTGALPDCLKVSAILEEIALHTQVLA